jgi:sulfur carrier protein ThiS adenylyltransferase
VNPNVSAKPLVVRLTPENVPVLLAPADVIVEAFDRADQKDMLVSTVLQRLPTKPLILGSGMAGWGGNQLLRTRRSGGLSVVGDECSEAGAGFGLMAPRVGAVAHLQANLVMELLLGADPGVTAAARAAGRSVE